MTETQPQAPRETWETTTAGGVWIVEVDYRGVERPRRIKGEAGHRFKITAADREASGVRLTNPKSDPFLNGTLRRVDIPTEKAAEIIPNYDADQALSDEELTALFASSGMAFQSKVKKLNERNVNRLAVLAEGLPDAVSQAQSAFIQALLHPEPAGAASED